MGGLFALHIASLLPGKESVDITQLLLDALADTEVIVVERPSPSPALTRAPSAVGKEQRPIADDLNSIISQLIGQGRQTALHLACSRQDDLNVCFISC